MYDENRQTDIFDYPMPTDMSASEHLFIWVLIALVFFLMFVMFPAFSMWLFSINQYKLKKSSTRSNSRVSSNGDDFGYGYRKYKCVADEVVDEVVHEVESPVVPIHRSAAASLIKPRIKPTPKSPVRRASKPPVKRAAKPPVKRTTKPPVKPSVEVTDSKIIEEAIGGLCSLGFSKTESKKVVNRACDGRVFTDAEELIKATLNRSNV